MDATTKRDGARRALLSKTPMISKSDGGSKSDSKSDSKTERMLESRQLDGRQKAERQTSSPGAIAAPVALPSASRRKVRVLPPAEVAAAEADGLVSGESVSGEVVTEETGRNGSNVTPSRALDVSSRGARNANISLDVTPRTPAYARGTGGGVSTRSTKRSSGRTTRLRSFQGGASVQTELMVGIAYDLKADFERAAKRVEGELPEDAFEEYDSEATVAALEDALSSNGYQSRRLGSGRSFLSRIMSEPGDIVFNIAEGYGTRSREAHVPSALEMLGVPYTHSDPLTLALTLDKAMAKRVAAAAGVPTPRFAVVEHADDARGLDLNYPRIAKPLFEGSSMGIRKHSRVTNHEDFMELIEQLLRDYREPVLVEEFASGPEFTVGILGSGATASVIGAMEIVPRNCSTSEFVYSLEVKRNYLEEVAYHVPPKRPTELVRHVESVALSAYRALGCRDVGRVDVRIGDDGEPKFLEVNPLPGLNPVTGDLVILARGNGISYHELVGRIVDGARQRQSI
jgi:D-alanine-D-alanine ligase